MKTWNIDIRRITSIGFERGLIRAQIDAEVQALPAGAAGGSASTLGFDEATARVLMSLLKTQLAALDAKKPRSRR